MVTPQNLFVGTLATLNTLVSPLSPTGAAPSIYKFDLQASPIFESRCRIHQALQKSQFDLTLEAATDTYFTAIFKIKICSSKNELQTAHLRLNLPMEILADAFIDRLPTRTGYVISGIPEAATDKGQPPLNSRQKVKITKFETESGLVPVTIEWLPNDSSSQEEPQPLKIWIARNPVRLSEAPAKQSRNGLHWHRVQFTYKALPFENSVSLDGTLKRVEQAQ